MLPGDRSGDSRTPHYHSYEQATYELSVGTIYLTTESVHAMYDQGGGAALAGFWDLIRSEPNGAGGFVWAFVDEGVFRTDAQRVDTSGNSAPDGVLGPYRQKEGATARSGRCGRRCRSRCSSCPRTSTEASP